MPQHLTWPNFSGSIIRPGEDRVHRVSTEPLIEIYADQSGRRLRLEIQRLSDDPVDSSFCRLLTLGVSESLRDGRPMLAVTCGKADRFREAYLFFTAVIDLVLEEGEDAARALYLELEALESLLDAGGILSVEKQIGLVGELMVLEQFLTAGGRAMMAAWTGPLKEAHDFRLAGREFEVKTTLGRRRIHTINGITQAVPSSGNSLCFISILLAVAGADEGLSLPSLILRLEAMLAGDHGALSGLGSALESVGYRAADADAYSSVWKLRSPMMLVTVDGAFPSLSPTNLIPAMGATYGRLEDISYKVSLDNAGILLEEGLSAHIETILLNNN
jgi:hypothetical protein